MPPLLLNLPYPFQWSKISATNSATPTYGGMAVDWEKKTEIEKMRQKIDQIDEAFLKLLKRRVEVARKIGELKGKRAILDPKREQEVIERITEKCSDLAPEGVRAIMQEIISLCRAVQERPKVACLGPEGSFSQQAAYACLGKSIDLEYLEDIESIFQAVDRKSSPFGIVPVENSIEGVVYSTLDAFPTTSQDVSISIEIMLPINHVLASKSRNISQVKEVHSHPQALAQCKVWLSMNLPKCPRKTTTSTSAAAMEAAKDERLAAICTPLAAELNKLNILARNIQDHSHNTTRFWLISKDESSKNTLEGKNKASILFTVAHRPGSLFRSLEPLRDAGLNMMFIQSRPLTSNPFEYLFFVDIELDPQGDKALEALKEMEKRCFSFRVLGIYPSFKSR